MDRLGRMNLEEMGAERRRVYLERCRAFVRAWWDLEFRPMPLASFSQKFRRQLLRYGIALGTASGRRELKRSCALIIVRGPNHKRHFVWPLIEWNKLTPEAQAWCSQFGDLRGYFGIPYKSEHLKKRGLTEDFD